MNTTFRVRKVHDKLLRGDDQRAVGLYQLHLATAEQLTRVLGYSPNSITLIQKRLKVLEKAGYVQPSRIIKGSISSGFYYTLGNPALRYLERLGFDVHEARRPSREVDMSDRFIEHTLELNDVIISAALLSKDHPGLSLESLIHDYELQRQPFVVEAGSQKTIIKPDAYLQFRYDGSRLGRRVMLEHDRGTEERKVFQGKISNYTVLLRQELFSDVQVAFVTFKGDDRLQEMRRWTRAVFERQATPVADGMKFAFSALPKPLFPGTVWLEPLWLPAYETDRPPEPLLAA